MTESAHQKTSLSPGFCVILFLISITISRMSWQLSARGTPTPLWFDMIDVAVDTLLNVWAQSSLNIAWHNLEGGAAPFKPHIIEWIVLALGGVFWALVIIGLMMP